MEIKERIPQSSIKLEYRKDDSQISFDKRYEFMGPFYSISDKLWETIDLRNGSFPIQDGPYIFDIPHFNQEVIRESIYNAVAHRDYTFSSEIIIKQSDYRLQVISPGGFPPGVTIENLIIISSTPRNRLLADVLQKTGLIERAGQGVDKIYYQTLMEGKSEPDYSKSSDFQVELHLSTLIEDKAFALFLGSVQSNLPIDRKLSPLEVIHLNSIQKGDVDFKIDKSIIRKLLKRNLIEQRGKTQGTYYVLSKEYYEFCDEKGKYSKTDWDKNQTYLIIIQYFKKFETAKMKDFIDLFEGRLTIKQVKSVVKKLVASEHLSKKGRTKDAYYTIGESYKKNVSILGEALRLGLKQMREND